MTQPPQEPRSWEVGDPDAVLEDLRRQIELLRTRIAVYRSVVIGETPRDRPDPEA
ncbi:hypothetical protein [Phenylobacterium sp.]|uniref:hypothetical protein n=1 Tax=Phenylobacterium sp. TaxID=1871053 RepID=UPI003BAC47B0